MVNTAVGGGWPLAQSVKQPPAKQRLSAVQKTWVRSLDQQDPGEGNGNLCSILAWGFPWTEKPSGYTYSFIGGFKGQKHLRQLNHRGLEEQSPGVTQIIKPTSAHTTRICYKGITMLVFLFPFNA